MAQKRSKWLVWLFVPFGLIGLFALLLGMKRKPNSNEVIPDNPLPETPQEIILRILQAKGMDLQTAQQWVSVSALETNGWKSQVFKDSRNLFCLIVPGKPALPYGEHQTIFDTMEASVEGLWRYVIDYWNYPVNFESIQEQAEFMKSKWYYGGAITSYADNMRYWYKKLFE